MTASGPFAPALQTAPAAVPGDVEQYLAGIQTTEGRLVATAVILVAALGLVAVVVPWIARRLGEPAEGGEVDDESTTIGALQSGIRILFARGLQLGVLVSATVALLVLWGRAGDAYSLLEGGGRPVDILGNVAITLAIGLVAYVAIDVLDETVTRFSEGADRVTDHEEEIIRRVGQLGVLALAVATGLTIWVENLSGLLVGAGFLGIVVGMAARQTLGSMIAGFVLMFSRPFTIGDWVEIGDQEGIVTDITIVNTRLENFDGEFVVLPNDMVGNRPITNRSRKGHLRLRQEVGVDYDSDPDRAQTVAIEAIEDLEAVETSPSPQAILTAFGDSAITIELRFWIDRPTPPRKWRATNAVVEAVHAAFDREGIKIPFPQRELTGRTEAGGFQIRQDEDERPPGVSTGTRRDDGDSDGTEDTSDGSEADTGDGTQAVDGPMSADNSETVDGTDRDGQSADEN